MHTWSKIRYKLENEYLANSLKGHIQYFATSYNKCPDHEGRAAILLNGCQIISGSYCEQWSKAPLLPKDETLEARLHYEFPFMDDTALKYHQFDQRCFYLAFYEFDNQSIEKSLMSKNLLIRIFAILDRRVGKRTLHKLKATIANEPEIFQIFYHIRIKAEGIRGNFMENACINICCECGSEFLIASSKMKELCPECANRIYGYENCKHVFQNGKCVKCLWNGNRSEYVKLRMI